jgi:excisionase family DNA binding protein
MEDRHLSLSEVAGLMGVSERTVRRWIKSGKLTAYKPGRDYRIPESSVREFVEDSEISPKGLRRSSLEPSLFNGLEDERREVIGTTWLAFVSRFVNRWDEKARTGNFDLGQLKEFVGVVDGLFETLPPWDEYGEDPQINATVWRLVDLLPQVSTAAEAKFKSADLKPIREKQAAQEAAFENITRRGA